MFLTEIPSSWLLVFALLLGFLFGSFLNVVIYRVPRGLNVAFPPSTCPSCETRIPIYRNIPVISWLLLRGKAACCGTRISPRYLGVELLGGLVAVAVMDQLVLARPYPLSVGLGLLTFALFLTLCLGLIAAVFIDLEHMILPDSITLGGAALGLLTASVRDQAWLDSLLGGAVGFAIVWLPFIFGYRLLRGQAGMGLGDAKLLMLAGTWFGWPGALFALMAGAVQGTIVAIAVFIARGKIDEPEAIKQERELIEKARQELQGAELEALEKEIAGDLLAEAAPEGIRGARIAFGPFLVLGILEYLFFKEAILTAFDAYFWNV